MDRELLAIVSVAIHVLTTGFGTLACFASKISNEECIMTKVSDISVITDAAKNLAKVYRVRPSTGRLATIEKQLLFCTVVFGLLFVVFSALFFVTYHYYAKLLKNRVCNTSECIESAMTLLQTVDIRHDPCEDFYSFACGRFPVDHPLGENTLHNSWFLEKDSQLNRMIRQILISPILSSDLTIVKQTKEFYQSCMNKSELNVIGFEPLYEILEKIELPSAVPNNQSASNFSLGRTLALAQRYLSQDIFVSVSIVKEPKNSTNTSTPNEIYNVFRLSPGVTTLGLFTDWKPNGDLFSNLATNDRNRKQKSDSAQTISKHVKAATISFIASIIEKISYDLEEEDAAGSYNVSEYVATAVKIMNFTTVLINASAEDTNDNGDDYSYKNKAKQTNLFDLENSMNDDSLNASVSNRIDWREYFNVLLEGLNGSYVIDNETILVENMNYFKTLSQILANATAETIQRHIWWKIVEKYAKYTTTDMRAVYLRYYNKLYGEIALESRSYMCTNLMKATMGVALSYEMSRNNNFTKTTEKVLEMLKDIRSVFETMVNSASWMDAPTKLVTLDKAKAVKNEIGYANWMTDPEKIDEYYQGLDLRESEFLLNLMRVAEWEVRKALNTLGPNVKNSTKITGWFIDPLQVNAYYFHEDNTIFIPAGILRTPFYFRGLESMNYGAIGTILGHELTHGFDIDGKNYNKFGERQDNLWPDEIVKKYEAKAKCFVRQYENYTVYDDQRLNGSYTLAENIADNGGLRESYKAYKLFSARYGQEPKLPGFENFTQEQLFFLSYANMWCETASPKFYMLSRDTHSPQRIRVLVTLQNMKEFAEAYNCPEKSFMNPTKRCIVW